jgi:hypothetical protein
LTVLQALFSDYKIIAEASGNGCEKEHQLRGSVCQSLCLSACDLVLTTSGKFYQKFVLETLINFIEKFLLPNKLIKNEALFT